MTIVKPGVLQGPICRPLFPNIFIHDLLFDDVKRDIGNYADDTNTNVKDLEIEKMIKLLE